MGDGGQTWSRWAKLVVALGFILWAGLFIRSSSVTLEDGRRVYCLTDDAMISMRYAQNLARGEGLVWNAGERVEGYTNPLWTLLMALPHLVLGRETTSLAVQVGGIAILLLIALLSGRWAELALTDADDRVRSIGSLTAFAVTLACYPLVYWTLMGMETGLVTLLVVAGACAALAPTTPGRLQSLGFCVALAYLTRPDAILLFLPLLATAAWSLRREPTASAGRQLVRIALPIAAAIALQLVFRRIYYGEWSPNTYFLKIVGIPLGLRLENGLLFVGPFLRQQALVLAVALAGAVWLRSRAAVGAAGVLIVALGYQVWAGGDVWFYWRLLAPGALMALLLCVVSLAKLIVRARALVHPGAGAPWLVAIPLAAAGLALTADWRFRGEILLWQPPYQSDFSRHLVPIGLTLREVLEPGARIAVGGAGIIPYFSDLYAVDYLGKNEKKIARGEPDLVHVRKPPMRYFPGHVKYALNYTFDTYAPDFMEYVAFGGERLRDEALNALIEVPDLGYFRANSPQVRWSRLSLRPPAPPT